MNKIEMMYDTVITFLLVTGCCFLAFTVFLSLLDELKNISFLWAGFICLTLAAALGAGRLLMGKKLNHPMRRSA